MKNEGFHLEKQITGVTKYTIMFVISITCSEFFQLLSAVCCLTDYSFFHSLLPYAVPGNFSICPLHPLLTDTRWQCQISQDSKKVEREVIKENYLHLEILPYKE